jgi:hypothetical protein
VPVAAAAAAPVAAETAGAGGPPPTEPPAGTGGGKRRGGPSLPIIAAIAVVAALASGAITYFATQGSSSKPSASSTTPSVPPTATTPTTPTTASTATTTTTTTGTTTTGPTTGTATIPQNVGLKGPDIQLLSYFSVKDQSIVNTCQRARFPGGASTLNCVDQRPQSAVQLHVDLFRKQTKLAENYRHDGVDNLKHKGGSPNSGACDTKTWQGEHAWARGRYLCFTDAAGSDSCKKLQEPCAVIYWYYTSPLVAVRATVPLGPAPAAATSELAQWWSQHKDMVGG